MPYPPDNPPHVFSVLAGREVSTWSEEWKHECEVRFLAGMTLADRNRTLEGEKDGLKGMKSFRGTPPWHSCAPRSIATPH